MARFISDVVDGLDPSAIYAAYNRKDGRGLAAYHPVMMVRLPLYGYCLGVASSSPIERRTHEDVALRYLAADQHPDHDTIASFRQTHLQNLAGLFLQALRLCEKVEVEKLLEEAARTDAEADAKYGQGKRGDELPAELARRARRLKKIAEAQAALEQEARERAGAAKAAAEARLEERRKPEEERGTKLGGRPPQVPDPEQAKPEPKAQRNFTDPDSRIMKEGATKSFLQGFHAQAAVDDTAQVIVGCAITQEANDKQQLVPMIQQVEQNLGRKPEEATADAGYFSVAAVTDPRVNGVELLAPPDRQKQEASQRERAKSSRNQRSWRRDHWARKFRPIQRRLQRVWRTLCARSCGVRKGTRCTRCARRWWNRCSGRSRSAGDSGAFYCEV